MLSPFASIFERARFNVANAGQFWKINEGAPGSKFKPPLFYPETNDSITILHTLQALLTWRGSATEFFRQLLTVLIHNVLKDLVSMALILS